MNFTDALILFPEAEDLVYEIVTEFQNELDSELDVELELDTDALERTINIFFNNILRISKREILDDFEIIASICFEPTTEHIVLQSFVQSIFDETMELKYKFENFGVWPISESAWKSVTKYTISMILYALDEIFELDTPAGIDIDVQEKVIIRRFFRDDLANQIRQKIREIYNQI